MKQSIVHHAIILSAAVLVLFTNLGTARLWDRDEPRNAGCAREMLERGDWVVPFFNGQMRGAKPVLLYWLIMSAYGVFGVNEFAARFWSAALAVGTVLATYQIGRRLFNPTAALWGALILSTSLMFDVAGRAATPDSTLIFCGTMAVMFYVLGTFKPRPAIGKDFIAPQLRYDGYYFPRRWPVVAIMYAFMGLGVLAKGPVGLVLPTAVIGMFLLIVRLRPSDSTTNRELATHDTKLANPATNLTRPQICGIALAVVIFLLVATVWSLKGLAVMGLSVAATMLIANRTQWLSAFQPFAPVHFLKTCWSMRPVTAIVICLAIALPWYLLVGLRTDGDFLYSFFLKEHFGRATTAMENHGGSPLFYPVAILVGFFPWSVFAAPVLIGLVRQMRRHDEWNLGYVFATCWVCVYVGIFTLASTKLSSYVTPCYPALALLTGSFMYRWTNGTSLVDSISPRLAIGALGLVGLLMAVAIPIVAHYFLPGSEWLGAIGLILVAGAAGCYVFNRRNELKRSSVVFAITSVAFVAVMFGLATVRVDRHQQSDVLFDEITRRGNDTPVGSYGCLESTWVFYTRRPIDELRFVPSEVRESVQSNQSQDWKPRPETDVASFFKADQNATLITTASNVAALKSVLPADVDVLVRTRYFLKNEVLVLLGRPARKIRTAKISDVDRR